MYSIRANCIIVLDFYEGQMIRMDLQILKFLMRYGIEANRVE